jgi:drug/metabolite transporter (DMT)-like permease
VRDVKRADATRAAALSPFASGSRLRHRAAMLRAADEIAIDDEREALRRGIAILVGSSLIFAVMAVCVRFAAREVPALQIAWVRFAGSCVLLFALGRRSRLRPRPGNAARVLQRALFGVGAIVCYFVAIERIGAGLATLLHAIYPIPTAVIAVLVLKEPASGRLAAAIVLNLIGLVLVVGPETTLGPADAVGVAISLSGALLASGAVTTARHLRASEPATLITLYFMAVGTVLTAPALAFGVPGMSLATAVALVGVVVTSAAGQWMLHHGLGYTPASIGSLACATGVFTAAWLEAVVLGEHMRAESVVGALLMIMAVGLAYGRRATVAVPAVDV